MQVGFPVPEPNPSPTGGGGPPGGAGATGPRGPETFILAIKEGVTLADSGKYFPFQSYSSVTVRMSLLIAGSTDTVVEIHRNGVLAHTMTLNASSTFRSEDLSLSFNGTSDFITLHVVTPGTNASGLVIQVGFN